MKKIKIVLLSLILAVCVGTVPVFAESGQAGGPSRAEAAEGTKSAGSDAPKAEQPAAEQEVPVQKAAAGAKKALSKKAETEEPAEEPSAEEPVEEPEEEIQTGVVKVSPGKYIYIDPKTKELRKKAGFVRWKGYRYFVKKNGRIITGREFKYKGHKYRAKDNGKIRTGVYKWKKSLWYANHYGTVRTKKGVVKWKGNKYYVGKGGKLKTNWFYKKSWKKIYFFKKSGKMAKKTFTYRGMKIKPNKKNGKISYQDWKLATSKYLTKYKRFILIDISEQRLYYVYKKKCELSYSVVTGDVTKGNGTPKGTYSIRSKATDVTLSGSNYSSHVNYWMAFIGSSYGIHDASWRSHFGGNIYKGNGSHGCVNSPYSKVKILYNKAPVGTPVIIIR